MLLSNGTGQDRSRTDGSPANHSCWRQSAIFNSLTKPLAYHRRQRRRRHRLAFSGHASVASLAATTASHPTPSPAGKLTANWTTIA
nr:hypothetical protein GCM10010200_100640 [Actinomadura rugatobispora]